MSNAEKRSLPVLRVADPCTEDWDAMRETAPGARHCEVCAHDVYDLSALDEDEVRAMVYDRSQRVCVRFYERADGTVVTADCTPARDRAALRLARQALRPAVWLARVALALLAALGVARAAGVGPSNWFPPPPKLLSIDDPVEEDVYIVMGLMAADEVEELPSPAETHE